MTGVSSATSFAEALLGPGFYKLAYVTNDRERAIAHWQERFGIEEFVRFEPAFEARTADGATGAARLRCAFSAGRKIVVEVMEPLEGLVDLWSTPLANANGFTQVFHHVGLVVDDLDAVHAAAAEHGLRPELRGEVANGRFSYLLLPGVGHYVEHMEYLGDDGDAFLRRVQSPRLG